MTATGPKSDRHCTFQQYTQVWEVGTGLRVSLAPGVYRITGEECFNGIQYLRLEETYRIDASKLPQ